MLTRIFFAAAVTLFFANAAPAAPIIDNFTIPNPAVSGSGVFNQVHNLGGGGTGVVRTINTAPLTGPGDVASVGANQFFPGIGTRNAYSMFTGTSTAIANLMYNFAGLPGGFINLSGLGIELEFAFLDPGVSGTMAPAILNLNTTSGPLTASVALMPVGSDTVFFAPFPFAGPGNIAQVTSLQLLLNSGPLSSAGVDVVLTRIEVRQASPDIPEPATVATFGVMALIGGYVARRKLKGAPVTQA